MEFIVVTGLSGSGKSGAANVLEDIGFYCVDNMPPQLITKFAEICMQSGNEISKAAVVIDIRGGEPFFQLTDSINEIRAKGLNVKILFLDAIDEVLVKRYKETRRKHPLDTRAYGNIHRAVALERELLSPLREVADYYLDTSFLSTSQLKEQINSIFLESVLDFMIVNVMSFGFKYGAPNEADLVFDVRCLPNPFYIEELKPLSGKDSKVSDYVMSFGQAKTLMDKLTDLIDFLIPHYVFEGKSQLVIAFGCTGGKHRSVTFAELLSKYLESKKVKVRITHRDILKGG